MRARWKGFRFSGMIGVLAVFLVMAVILFTERLGIRVSNQQRPDPYLPIEQVVMAEDALKTVPVSCLLVTDLGREDCAEAYEQFSVMLADMKINYDLVDLGSQQMPAGMDAYETAVFLTPDLDAVGESVLTVCDWVKEGGRALFAMTLEDGMYEEYIRRKIGIMYTGTNTMVDEIYFDEDFLLGGGRTYYVTDGFDSARSVQLQASAVAYAWQGGKDGIPLIWSNEYGKGRFVVDNLGIYEKVNRGLYAASYSLLEDVCAYPVLNGTVFFLDDMPSPVPGGDATYITRDYHMDISSFYTNIWFRDVLQLSEKYEFPLTAVMIENYEDDTSGDVEQQPDTSRFAFFGNQLLRAGGELGFHGYNHQPLMPDTVDYGGAFEYNTWGSETAMANAMNELFRFGKSVFPDASMSVYVPPSNILSKEGRALLGGFYPQIRTVASTYNVSAAEFAYSQEFGVAADGVVEEPRTVSGAIIDDYMMMESLSELNMHMVCTHFMHPDDTLDEDRGAALGWGTLRDNLDHFMDWLFSEAPGIRRLTASELSGTVQRWSGLTVSKSWENDRLTVTLGNYVDEAYLMMRFHDGAPRTVNGGTLTKLTESLYLLEAQQAEITMEWS